MKTQRQKNNTDSWVFSQSEDSFSLAHRFFLSVLHPCYVTYSKFLYIQTPPHPHRWCVGPQNIHLHHPLYHLLYVFFSFIFNKNKHRSLGRQCKSRNSVKLLRNALVGFMNIIFSSWLIAALSRRSPPPPLVFTSCSCFAFTPPSFWAFKFLSINEERTTRQ